MAAVGTTPSRGSDRVGAPAKAGRRVGGGLLVKGTERRIAGQPRRGERGVGGDRSEVGGGDGGEPIGGRAAGIPPRGQRSVSAIGIDRGGGIVVGGVAGGWFAALQRGQFVARGSGGEAEAAKRVGGNGRGRRKRRQGRGIDEIDPAAPD